MPSLALGTALQFSTSPVTVVWCGPPPSALLFLYCGVSGEGWQALGTYESFRVKAQRRGATYRHACPGERTALCCSTRITHSSPRSNRGRHHKRLLLLFTAASAFTSVVMCVWDFQTDRRVMRAKQAWPRAQLRTFGHHQCVWEFPVLHQHGLGFGGPHPVCHARAAAAIRGPTGGAAVTGKGAPLLQQLTPCRWVGRRGGPQGNAHASRRGVGRVGGCLPGTTLCPCCRRASALATPRQRQGAWLALSTEQMVEGSSFFGMGPALMVALMVWFF